MEHATLYIGAGGEGAAMLKRVLKAMGYTVGEGAEYDVKTRRAVESFQNDSGLAVDGVVGHETWQALERAYGKMGGASAGALREGDMGAGVMEIQEKLIALHFMSGKADGKYGPVTENAVRSFQAAYGLEVNGAADEKTKEALCGAFDSGASVSASSYNGKLEERGDDGTDIRRIQSRLNELGYDCGTADGIFGTKTEAAVKAFQREHGLKTDGIVGEKTWAALFGGMDSGSVETARLSGLETVSDGTLKRGCEGERVMELQRKLKACGLYTGNIDGIYGPLTEYAVMTFQRREGLAADGICGAETRSAIFAKDCAETAPAAGYDTVHGVGGYTVVGGGAKGGTFPRDNAGGVGITDNNYYYVTANAMTPNAMANDSIAPAAKETVSVYNMPKPGDSVKVRSHIDDYPALWYGDYGNYVKELQERLSHIQRFFGHVSGVFDQETLSAVKAFQKAHGMYDDGVVRKELWEKLRVGL